ncbi:hypothetical protein GGI25_001095 [Coemansia spiralis]|uniref:Uncharacterized protein n=1 Tax=Coemansia spiralis TaxID=417178 RepID=A0A9W8L0D1_9FUNG|nr:hypothetical protein GGI25_001095 [Coemansia spiralis]
MPGLFGSPTVPYKFQVFDVNNTEHEASGTLQFAAYGLDKEDPVFLIPLAVKDQG